MRVALISRWRPKQILLRSFGSKNVPQRETKQSSKLLWGFAFAASSIGGGIFLKQRAVGERRKLNDSQLPLTYDPEAIASFWKQHHLLVGVRLGEIGYQTVPFLCGTLWDNLVCYIQSVSRGQDFKFSSEDQRKWGEKLRELLVELGPAFIKLGQIFSIRPDLLPAPVLFELQKLCDAVPAYPTEDAIALIEEELGDSAALLKGLTSTSEPVAAASLGQVYKCRLEILHKGKVKEVDVAVKVQRPGMIAAVSLDLYITRALMGWVEAAKAVMMDSGVLVKRKQFDVSMLDNFARASYFELDYEHEARNQETFASKLKTHGIKQVQIPEVYRQATSRRVLATEWIEGIQLAKSSPEVIKRLVPVGVECFLVQLLDMGFFHGDPHPGNLLVNSRGELVIIDFGLCAEVSGPSSAGMTTALVHLIRGDVPELLEDAINMGFLPETVNKSAILPAFERIYSQGYIARSEVQSSAKNHLYQASVRRHQFRAISSELNSVFYEFPFVVPEYFALITRALIVLEGIAVTGDPDFDIFAASYPYARKKALKLLGSSWSE